MQVVRQPAYVGNLPVYSEMPDRGKERLVDASALTASKSATVSGNEAEAAITRCDLDRLDRRDSSQWGGGGRSSRHAISMARKLRLTPILSAQRFSRDSKTLTVNQAAPAPSRSVSARIR